MTYVLLIHNAAVVVPHSSVYGLGWVLCRDGRIERTGNGQPPDVPGAQAIDAGGLTLLPGFIDIHVHGGKGVEAMDATPVALQTMAAFYARHGVTAFLATTWTSSAERIRAALETIRAKQGQMPDGATLLGAHVEGPYLNPARCGAQDTKEIRRATPEEVMPLLETGAVRLMALAPEYEENLWLIEECVRRGIAVSAAHTDATYEQMERAVALGLSQTTHTFNAMSPLHQRAPGVVGAALALAELRCELIADNIHVHPAVMRLLYLAKGPDGVILITDAVRGAGLAQGSAYEQDGRRVTLRDGSAFLDDGTLAGSVLTMDRAVRNFTAATGQPLEVIWPASSLNAARTLGVERRKGSIEAGKDADLALVDGEMTVRLTVAEGRIVYREGI